MGEGAGIEVELDTDEQNFPVDPYPATFLPLTRVTPPCQKHFWDAFEASSILILHVNYQKASFDALGAFLRHNCAYTDDPEALDDGFFVLYPYITTD